MPDLTDAVTQALAIGAIGSDPIGLILDHAAQKPIGLFSLDRRPHLKAFSIPSSDLGALSQTGT